MTFLWDVMLCHVTGFAASGVKVAVQANKGGRPLFTRHCCFYRGSCRAHISHLREIFDAKGSEFFQPRVEGSLRSPFRTRQTRDPKDKILTF